MIRTKILRFCFLMLVLSLPRSAFAADPATQAEGKEHFKAGVAYMDDPSGAKLDEAHGEFKKAYSILQSHMILPNIGFCALHLERDAEAIEAYSQFLEKSSPGDVDSRQRAQMQSDVQMLSASLVTVSLQIAPGNANIVDERFPTKGPTIVNRYALASGTQTLGIHPGHHRITAIATGFEPQSWEFDAPPASKHVREFKLSPIAGKEAVAPTPAVSPGARPGESAPTAVASQRPVPGSVYLGAAVTGLFIVGTTATGVLAFSKKSDFDDLNRDGLHPAESRSARDSANQYAWFTNVGLGAAAISGGITAYLYLSRPSVTPKEHASRKAWEILPSIGPAHANLNVSGRF